MNRELAARYANKRKAVRATGRNYLLSRVRALAARAEFFNLQERTSDARKALKEARELISSELVIFATEDVISTYDPVAGVLDVAVLSEQRDTKVFASIYKQKRTERKEESERMAAEAMRNFKAKGGGREKIVGGIVFIYIPGGSFMMGSPEGEGDNDERPQHRVTLNGFWMSRYEITQPQFTSIMREYQSRFEGANRPVEQVSWEDATEFCERLTARSGTTVRLPTEAEWEYACRAGGTTRYYWGDEMDGSYCWYEKNSGGETHPIGTKKPNAWGLYDMNGNVWEWCQDWYDGSYYENSHEKNPAGAAQGEYRVFRGGSWINNGNNMRVALRSGNRQMYRVDNLGFRCVLPSP
jgi:formylglycine-generating enzyme required for sulfatase activity